jgi:[ribosomal protein S18]-alanine N-acetyltransferase
MLRQVGPDEAGLLAAIHGASFPPQDAWGADALRLMLEMPGAFGLWQPADGLILARAAAGEAEILTLAVAPAARRRGRGGILLGAALRTAGLRGAGEMFLEVAAGNASALALYAAAGFIEVGRRRRYYANGEDALVMRRRLQE